MVFQYFLLQPLGVRRYWLCWVLLLEGPALMVAAGPSAVVTEPGLMLLNVKPATAEAVASELRERGYAAVAFPDLDAVAFHGPTRVPDVKGVLGAYPNSIVGPLLDRTVPYVGAPNVWEVHGERGANVSVFVLDTGIDGTHPDVRLGENLVQNVVPTRTENALPIGYLENQPLTDVGGHGTHVAGIVGASGAGSGHRYVGMAPGVRIVGFSAGVTDPRTSETMLDGAGILAGFQYVLDRREEYDIRVVSNSWGTNETFDPEHPITRATLALYRAGLVVVFAAGNEGQQGEATMNPYSVAPWVLSVAAGDLQGRRAEFSSMGTDPRESGLAYDHPDLVAPGVRVVAPKASGDVGDSLFLPQPTQAGAYTAKSGTSMAAPHAAGAAALLLSRNPQLSPDQVHDLLVATARPMEGPLWHVGRGHLDAYHAFNVSLQVEGDLSAFLGGRVRYGGPESGDPSYARDASQEATAPEVEPAPSPGTPAPTNVSAEPRNLTEPSPAPTVVDTPPVSPVPGVALSIGVAVWKIRRSLASRSNGGPLLGRPSCGSETPA